jgi:flagellar biosynthesis anti-sigma factor FlgM
MINGIGLSGNSLVDAARQQATQRGEAVSRPNGAAREDIGAVSTTISQLAAGGAPVDGSRVDALRASIRAGAYRVDPQAIAGKMVDTDLGAAL